MSEKTEDLLWNYVQGLLSADEVEKLERDLKKDQSLRQEWVTMQQVLEEQVAQLDDDLNHPSLELKAEILMRVKELSSNTIQSFEKEEKRISIPSNVVTWSGWAVAAALLLAFVTQTVMIRNTPAFTSSSRPALAVFDLPSDSAADQSTSTAKIREVVYSGNGKDGLLRAEHYVERLWDELENAPESARGFLVIDLQGGQGFFGFREQEKNDPTLNQKLWIANQKGDKKVPIGSLPMSNDAAGVYYFNLEDEDMPISSPEEVKPIVEFTRYDGI